MVDRRTRVGSRAHRRARARRRVAATVVAVTVAAVIGGTVAALAAGGGSGAKSPPSAPTASSAPITTPSTGTPGSSNTNGSAGAQATSPPQAANGGNVSSSHVSMTILTAVSNGAGSIQVRGVATAGSKATVNGVRVTIAPDGSWSINLPVHRGQNTVTATAVSADGSNRSQSTVTVNG